MKKSVIVLFLAALFSINATAQTVQEGVAHWYAERNQSARTVFEKLTAANPNNLEAVYWLGQTLLSQKDTAAAKALYQKTLASNGNAPWILAGMGHINLLEGRAAEARAQFDAAIAASKVKKGNDPAVLAAVGRANVQAYSDDRKLGDIEYAIAKLNEAVQLAPTNPDVALVLGNAYRKKHEGGSAVQAYRKAGNYAPALYRIASLYSTQKTNKDVVLENLNAAIAADARFAPAYEDLYYYYLTEVQDIPKADAFGKQYVSSSDPSVENDYILAQTAFVQKNFQQSIDIANKIIQQTNNNPKPRVYRLLTYSYLGLKDSAKACEYSNTFLAKAPQDFLIPKDYLQHAAVCGRGNPAMITQDITRALALDKEPAHQITVLNDAIKDARAQGQRGLEARLMLMLHTMRAEKANPADLFYVGTVLYYSDDFITGDSVLTAYITAFPDSLQGYYWRALTRLRIDTSMTIGAFVPDFEKTIQLATTDTARFKSQSSQAAQTLVIYHYNVKKDKAAAQAIVAKGLQNDPTNETLSKISDQLKGATKPTSPPKTETKTKSDGGIKTKTKADNGTKTKTKTKK